MWGDGMNKKQTWRSRLSLRADFDIENQFQQPLVEICGEKRIYIENHSGVIEYGTERIGVRVRYGSVYIVGCDLRLCHMSGRQLLIRGKIESVSLLRGE